MLPRLPIVPGMRFLKPRHVAELCGVTKKTVTLWISKGLLPAERSPTGQYRLEPSDVIAFANRHRYNVPAELMAMAQRVATSAT